MMKRVIGERTVILQYGRVVVVGTSVGALVNEVA